VPKGALMDRNIVSNSSKENEQKPLKNNHRLRPPWVVVFTIGCPWLPLPPPGILYNNLLSFQELEKFNLCFFIFFIPRMREGKLLKK